MAIRTLDELNNLSTTPEQYFGEMDLTEEQREERIAFTDGAYSIILDVMYEIDTYREYGLIDFEAIKQTLNDRMAALIAGYVVVDDYLRQYCTDYAENFINTTIRNIETEWYLSQDRALFNAENGANDTLNYKDYKEAVEKGYKRKKWVSEHDNKVRDTHRIVDGTIIPINDYFDVGGVLMRFPKDYELAFDAPWELINCRCVCKWLK